MSADDAERRIRELEEQVRRKEREAAGYKDYIRYLVKSSPIGNEVPDDPPTEAEMEALMRDTGGTPILDIIAEYEERLES
jgi:hypothetical protein